MKTRTILRWLRLPVLSAAALLALAGSAAAQNISTWAGAGGDGNWSTAANWDMVPVSGPDTELVFSGAANLATNNNIANPFTLTSLTYDGSALTNSISGGALTFAPGTNPATINTGSGMGRMLINSNVSFTSATTFNINSNNGNGAELFFAGSVTNPVGNTITINTVPPGTLVMLTGANNTNLAGTWAQNASTLTQLGAVNAMWRQTVITLTGTCAVTAGTTTAAGYGILDAGYNQQIGSVSGTGQFLVGTTDGAATVLLGFTNANTTLSGSAGLAGFNNGSHFGKVGTGTLTVTNENASFNTAMSVRDGNLTLSGALGSVTNSLAGPGAISVYAGAQLRANNTTAPNYGGTQGRLSDTAEIRMVGGTLRFDGGATLVTLNGTTNSTVDQAGTIRPFAGQSVIQVNANAAQPARFAFLGVNEADLARGGMVAFVGPNLGAAPAPGVAGVTIGGTVTAVNGVIPWALTQTGYVGSTTLAVNVTDPNSLVTMGANGIGAVTVFTDNDLSSGTNNVRLNAPAAPAGAASANSLTFETGGSLVLAGPLNLTSGAIMNRAATASISGAGVVLATGRLYVSSSAGNTLNVTAPIQATGLSKGGNGTVSVAGVNLPAGGIIQVNSGTLNVAGPVSTGAVFQFSRGSTLSGPTSIGGTLRGNGTFNGALNMAAGSLIGGSSLANAASATGATPGTMTIAGPLSFTGGSNGTTNTRLRFYLSSVFGGQYTQGLITTTALDLSGVTPGAPMTVQPHSILLSNNDTGNVYDFTPGPTQTYTWTMISSTAPIVGFDPAAYTIDLANFTNPGVSAADFTVGVQGNNLVLTYAQAVPEPSLLCVVGLGLLAAARLRRKA